MEQHPEDSQQTSGASNASVIFLGSGIQTDSTQQQTALPPNASEALGIESESESSTKEPPPFNALDELTNFLLKVSSMETPPTKPDLFNTTSPFNRDSKLFSGPFSNKDDRSKFFEIMITITRGEVELVGNPPRQTVVFSEDFKEFIPKIVGKFLEYLASKSSKEPILTKTKHTKAPSTTCSHGFECTVKSVCCPRGGGGGAAAAVPSSSKSSVTMTFADFLASKKKDLPQAQPMMSITICSFFGKCNKGDACVACHPVNSNIGMVKVSKFPSKCRKYEVASAMVCPHFPNCRNLETCTNVHLSDRERERALLQAQKKAVSKEEKRKEE